DRGRTRRDANARTLLRRLGPTALGLAAGRLLRDRLRLRRRTALARRPARDSAHPPRPDRARDRRLRPAASPLPLPERTLSEPDLPPRPAHASARRRRLLRRRL